MSDFKICANEDGTGVVTLKSPNTDTDRTILLPDADTTLGVTDEQAAVLDHLSYDPVNLKIIADRAIETTLNSLYLGEQHKMSSGSENIFFTNLSSDINFFPMWGGLKDQSIVANQGASGFIPPSGRVYSDMFSLPLGGAPNPLVAVGYEGDNYFGINITGLGITTTAAEEVPATIRLEYRIVINGRQVYMQPLPRAAARSTAAAHIYPGDVIEWFFDHPVDVRAGTTLHASIHKVRIADDVDIGVFQVCQGDTVDPNTGLLRYQATVHNRLFEDKDIELISPYLKYKTMDFSADATGVSILLKDLSLPVATQLLVPHNINTLQAVADGTEIQIKIKGGAKIIVESLPVSGVSINGSLVNSVLNTAVAELNTLFTNASSFSSAGGNPVNSFVMSGNNLTLGLQDGTSYTVDVTTLGVDTNKFVSSGALNGSDLVLTMSDSSVITIDATNMINGATTFAGGADWYYSYGDRANESVNNTLSDQNLGIAGRAPFYFGTALARGTEFRWNNNPNASHLLGIWDGTEAHAGTYNSRVPSNWSTAFNYHVTGFQASSNVSLTNTTATGKYTPSFGAPLALRFLNDGHITLNDLSGATEVEISKTINPLVVDSFQLQLGCDANFIFPQFVVTDSENLWEVVHDYSGNESGILNGILDHTVIKSDISIVKGEKLMFMLDEVGVGDYFGTAYNNAATGIVTAEEQLDNQFVYQTNEALVFTQGGANDWDMNTNAGGYFFAANLDQYREGGGSGTVQGMFSLRFNNDGKLTVYDEDAGVKVATAKMDPAEGSSIHLYFGVKGNRAYYSIPVVSKQSLSQSNQPDSNYVPTVADQTVTVTEAQALNFQIVSSNNIVNQFVAVDAPSWMSLNQDSGILSGTAPAHAGTAADTIVVTCKAGNAIGGTVGFTVTVTVAQAAGSYTNSKSLQFDGSSTFVQGNATLMDAMDRASNGDNSAWTLSMWIKTTASTATQTLFNYGTANDYAGGAITLKKINGNTLALTYGTVYNSIITLAGGVVPNTWQHAMITFDGGTTGGDPNDISDYYSRFNVYIDGVAATTVSVNSNQGYTGTISGEDISDNIFRLGRANNVHNNYLDGAINQVAIWNSDQSANLAAIYNSGSTHDLSLLAAAPSHYYEIEASATSITDISGSANLVGYNLTSSDLVSDTP